MHARDPSGLDRFIVAQDDPQAGYARAMAELAEGRKRSHWMWYVLPQLRGLGRSATAWHFGLTGVAQAQAFAAHPVLGPRLRHAAEQLAELAARPRLTADAVFGALDATKLRSCMTLFERADPGEPAYAQVLDRWYGGVRDPLTLEMLEMLAMRGDA